MTRLGGHLTFPLSGMGHQRALSAAEPNLHSNRSSGYRGGQAVRQKQEDQGGSACRGPGERGGLDQGGKWWLHGEGR